MGSTRSVLRRCGILCLRSCMVRTRGLRMLLRERTLLCRRGGLKWCDGVRAEGWLVHARRRWCWRSVVARCRDFSNHSVRDELSVVSSDQVTNPFASSQCSYWYQHNITPALVAMCLPFSPENGPERTLPSLCLVCERRRLPPLIKVEVMSSGSARARLLQDAIE